MDEASRETVPGALVPLSYLKPTGKVIFVGDAKQLPPFGLKEEERQDLRRAAVPQEALEAYNQSAFEWLLGRSYGDRVLLSTNYRSHPLITGLISHLFYEDDIHRRGWEDFDTETLSLRVVDIAEEPDVYYEDPGFLYRNTRSAEQVLQLIRLYEARSIPLDQITVITPYNDQVELIRQLLQEAYPQATRWPFVTTIDSYQGGENRAIIFDFVRSNADRRIGFVKDLRRLNVGLSRAQENLSIIWDSRTFTGEPTPTDSPEDRTARALFRRLQDYYESEVRTFFPEPAESNGSVGSSSGPSPNTPLTVVPFAAGVGIGISALAAWLTTFGISSWVTFGGLLLGLAVWVGVTFVRRWGGIGAVTVALLVAGGTKHGLRQTGLLNHHAEQPPAVLRILDVNRHFVARPLPVLVGAALGDLPEAVGVQDADKVPLAKDETPHAPDEALARGARRRQASGGRADGNVARGLPGTTPGSSPDTPPTKQGGGTGRRDSQGLRILNTRRDLPQATPSQRPASRPDRTGLPRGRRRGNDRLQDAHSTVATLDRLFPLRASTAASVAPVDGRVKPTGPRGFLALETVGASAGLAALATWAAAHGPSWGGLGSWLGTHGGLAAWLLGGGLLGLAGVVVGIAWRLRRGQTPIGELRAWGLTPSISQRLMHLSIVVFGLGSLAMAPLPGGTAGIPAWVTVGGLLLLAAGVSVWMVSGQRLPRARVPWLVSEMQRHIASLQATTRSDHYVRRLRDLQVLVTALAQVVYRESPGAAKRLRRLGEEISNLATREGPALEEAMSQRRPHAKWMREALLDAMARLPGGFGQWLKVYLALTNRRPRTYGIALRPEDVHRSAQRLFDDLSFLIELFGGPASAIDEEEFWAEMHVAVVSWLQGRPGIRVPLGTMWNRIEWDLVFHIAEALGLEAPTNLSLALELLRQWPSYGDPGLKALSPTDRAGLREWMRWKDPSLSERFEQALRIMSAVPATARIEAKVADPEEALGERRTEQGLLRSIKDRVLATLSTREERVIRARYSQDERSFEAIGAAWGVSRQDVGAIAQRALGRLRQPSRAQWWWRKPQPAVRGPEEQPAQARPASERPAPPPSLREPQARRPRPARPQKAVRAMHPAERARLKELMKQTDGDLYQMAEERRMNSRRLLKRLLGDVRLRRQLRSVWRRRLNAVEQRIRRAAERSLFLRHGGYLTESLVEELMQWLKGLPDVEEEPACQPRPGPWVDLRLLRPGYSLIYRLRSASAAPSYPGRSRTT
ncbi:MAG: hypothetical protein HYW10_02020 [Candidatus Omnitrophica bacterium]|nr:hypothetical protein [Candidatus Omnitrophota bacterium]